jgi:two-component system, chemotaxis family, protein-glutamate methylesterase/glutaminase
MIRVLVVDDSAAVRRVLRKELGKDPDIQVVASARDPFEARDLLVAHTPDVMTLDLEMPRMDGLTFLSKLMKHRPLPVVVVSSYSEKGGDLAMEAMALGAVEVLGKPTPSYSPQQFAMDLVSAVKAAAAAHPRTALPPDDTNPAAGPSCRAAGDSRIVALGASTGGTVALEAILKNLPEDFPGLLVTQHMPAGFTQSFARRLDGLCRLEVREACDGDEVTRGLVLIAPGGHHMVLRQAGARYRVAVTSGPRVNRHRPSVDVTFRSVARVAGASAVGVLLTGMGRDGAQGLLEIRQVGGLTVAQDERSSVVFGMPKAAIDIDAAMHVASLGRIASLLTNVVAARTAPR